MNNFIAYINGPTGIGKTTIATHLAQAGGKGVAIDIDIVKHFIKTGVLGEMITYREEIASTKKGGAHESYYRLIAETTCDIADRFYHEGYNVVISDMMWEDWIVEIYKKRLSTYRYEHFMLEMSNDLYRRRLEERTHQERILQKFAAEQIHEKTLAAAVTKNSIVITDEEMLGRAEAFGLAMGKVDRSLITILNIDNLAVDEICNRILSHFNQKASSQ